MEAAPLPATFATTHWSQITAACGASSPGSRQAWEALARDYWRPLYGHARRRGHATEDARDLVQAFFTRLIEKPILHQARRERGRFRTFLLTAFDHFLCNERDRTAALKRGGSFEFVTLPEGEASVEPADPSQAPERLFDRDWAQSVFSHALRKLEDEFAGEGKQGQFTTLAPFLSSPPGAGDYERAARTLGVRANLMATIVSRLRQRFRELVRMEIANTVATASEVDAELSYFVELMAG